MAKQLQPEWTFKWEAFEETRDFPLTVKMVREPRRRRIPMIFSSFCWWLPEQEAMKRHRENIN